MHTPGPMSQGPHGAQPAPQLQGLFLGQGPSYGDPPRHQMPLYNNIPLPLDGSGLQTDLQAIQPQTPPLPPYSPPPPQYSQPTEAHITTPDHTEVEQRTPVRNSSMPMILRRRECESGRHDAASTRLDELLGGRRDSRVFLRWRVVAGVGHAAPGIAPDNLTAQPRPEWVETALHRYGPQSDWLGRPATVPEQARLSIWSAELGDIVVDARPGVGYVRILDVLLDIALAANNLLDAHARAPLPGASTRRADGVEGGRSGQIREAYAILPTSSRATANQRPVRFEPGSNSELGHRPSGGLAGWRWGGLRRSSRGGWKLKLYEI